MVLTNKGSKKHHSIQNNEYEPDVEEVKWRHIVCEKTCLIRE